MNAADLAAALRASRGFQHKRDLGDVFTALQRTMPGRAPQRPQPHPHPHPQPHPHPHPHPRPHPRPQPQRPQPQPAGGNAGCAAPWETALGDDCAAIPDGDGYLLFAIEGFVEDFVRAKPWFAGYCSVMVNVSDIYAMGGRPLAIVDALWSHGMHPAADILAGMGAAAQRYQVPIVGGHSNNRSERGQLAAAILGRATHLLSSFAARPGDQLIMAVDLRGRYEDPYPYWNASTQAPAERLRADLELLPELAEGGRCDAAKDISMAGTLGTVLMLLECSQVGATLQIEALPRPAGDPPAAGSDDTALLRWLTAFPSYGFILSVRPAQVAAVLAKFHQRDLAAAVCGEVTPGVRLDIHHRGGTATLWNLDSESFMAHGLRAAAGEAARA